MENEEIRAFLSGKLQKIRAFFERIIHFYALFGLCNYSGYIF